MSTLPSLRFDDKIFSVAPIVVVNNAVASYETTIYVLLFCGKCGMVKSS
jgi:hypothetical protein